jgi:heptaprenyl diphosphate synthase
MNPKKPNFPLTDTKFLTQLSLLTALSLGIYGLESLLPPLFPIPGMKLGLANIITLVALRRYGPKSTALVLFVRCLLAALLFGQMLSLAYSLAGGFVCLLAELLIDRLLKQKALYLTSSFGGLFHNLGQLAVACLITASAAPLTFLPYLIIAGILTGCFVGLCSHFLLRFPLP